MMKDFKLKLIVILMLMASHYCFLESIISLNASPVLSWMLNIGYFLLYEGTLLNNRR